ncbi:MAG: dihydroorotate dehydrogenase electron transfer subunit [Syntrophaceticus sp.]|nr:dihydroorotate dehydrogenase electron transfer subunit [Syntrophaceticus sp.]MDD3314913.1 dihydroorotate dehydrogenase electron transfer subunit [Syntrophaceticus sp.]MDD4359400.1 dihydroorotate dehydrogenase electron transfer subunit [Syntrophaceticus sp.]MDD4782489.1 dihydroorotate dehydrogenase electron transfer subunit [Syntrophaceticus sp.]
MNKKDGVENVKSPGEYTCRVSEHLSLAPDYYLLSLEAPELSRAASPGEFAMLRCGEGYDNFLRRPMSIHQVDRSKGQVVILYQVRGKGTNWLSKRTNGDLLSLLGPLGHGYTCSGPTGKGLLIGAGVGVAPLLFLASELAARQWELVILMGARSKAGILRPDAYMEYGEVKTATEDGSVGILGTILDLAANELENSTFDMIFSCGSLPVLRGVQELSRQKGIPAELSLDERMACGVGACVGCVCQGADGSYLKVCQDGPVFSAGEVSLNG